MIKLFTLKQQRKDEQSGGSGGGDKDKVPGKPSTSAAQIRIQKDIAELSLPKTMKISFPNPDDLLNFELEIRPDEGFYYRGKFLFTFNIKSSYPHDPPKVLCKQKIYHPNIDLDGNICLNILREDWKPVLNLNAVIYGLSFLFLEPNPDDPLNKEAAQVLRTHRSQFESNVKTSMAGGRIGNEKYDNVLL